MIDSTEPGKMKFVLMNIYGRPVFVRKFTDWDKKIYGDECEDCLGTAEVLVYELDGHHWKWCGHCGIGG